MNILITGAQGFVGKNLIASLETMRNGTDRAHKIRGLSDPMALCVLPYDLDHSLEQLEEYCAKADFVFHLAGVNRPQEDAEFMEGNVGFSSVLLNLLKKHNNRAPIVLSSSVQASLEGRYANSKYGESKLAGEQLFQAYAKETGATVLIYRFPNIFGKWCRPNYNSAIATFSHNIARGLPITVNDRSVQLELLYIDDLIEELLRALNGEECRDTSGFCCAQPTSTASLGELVDLLHGFRASRTDLSVPDVTPNELSGKLYATYLSYLPQDQFSYPLKMNCDDRGSFTEIIRTKESGQFSVNISKPGIVKGNHWHHTKNEKFLVVSGKGVIRFRQPDSTQVIEYFVSGNTMEVIDIPTGYTHNIENLGDTDLVTFMWCSECFNPEKPDTYFLEV